MQEDIVDLLRYRLFWCDADAAIDEINRLRNELTEARNEYQKLWEQYQRSLSIR